MIPETTSPDETHPVKVSAYEVHRALLELLLNRADLAVALSVEEIDRLLKEYIYRGTDIRYSQGRTQDATRGERVDRI